MRKRRPVDFGWLAGIRAGICLQNRELAGLVRIGHLTCHCGKKALSRDLIRKQ